jgi:hypothetical protein
VAYRVYVIELDDRVGKRVSPRLPAVYVGQTAHSPEERFANHKRGHRASRHVRRYGTRLRPDLFAHLAPVATRREAEALEQETADRLKRKGYTVYGGH